MLERARTPSPWFFELFFGWSQRDHRAPDRSVEPLFVAADRRRHASTGPGGGFGPSPAAQPQAIIPSRMPTSAATWRSLGAGSRALAEQIQTASPRAPEFRVDLEQPPSSRVTCQVSDDGVTLSDCLCCSAVQRPNHKRRQRARYRPDLHA
jgi:hypothetical protein